MDVVKMSSSSTIPPLLSRHEVAFRICQGDLLLIYHDKVINARAWLSHHPGGALAILHFVGRDATHEIEAYHSNSAIRRMDRMIVGRVEVDEECGWKPLSPPISLGLIHLDNGAKECWTKEGDVALASTVLQNTDSSRVLRLSPDDLEPPEPSVDPRVERVRSRAYNDLRARVMEAGLFKRPGPLAGYGSDLLRYSSLAAIAFTLFFK